MNRVTSKGQITTINCFCCEDEQKKARQKEQRDRQPIPRLVLELCNGDKRGISPNYALVGGFFFPI